MAEAISNKDSERDGIHDALTTFTDFIYAVAFVIIIQQAFDKIINTAEFPFARSTAQLLLLGVIFYFFMWDWVLGRILTVRNPYQSYTRFICEILISAFAYGTASAAIDGKIIFLVHLSGFLFFGGCWAKRTSSHVRDRDSKEMCTIQILQFIASGIILIFYFWWIYYVGTVVTWRLVMLIFMMAWFFIFAYETMVPRSKGVEAGPGVPFIARSDVRRISRFLSRFGILLITFLQIVR